MASNNSITITGNMMEPEVRNTSTGKSIASARNGCKKLMAIKKICVVTIKMWENLATNVANSFPTGAKTMRVSVYRQTDRRKMD